MPLADIRSTNLSRTQQVAKPLLRARGGIVTAQNRQAAAVGARVLRDGGSAVDAAIATSFALGVLEPWMSGIGGVAALLVRAPDGGIVSIDAGAQSPAGLDPADFPLVGGRDQDLFGWPRVLEDRNVTGAKAVCVPSLVAGLAAAHARFGRAPWRDLVMPAVALARRGLMVDFHTTGWIAHDMARLMRNDACRAWLLPDGYPPATPAAVLAAMRYLAAPRLADTLQTIADEGADAFYRGPLADALAHDVQALGGYLSAADLARCAAIAGPAATQPYRGYTLHVGPQLNGGITVALAMRASARSYLPDADAADDGARLTAAIPAYCDALLDAWRDRLSRLGDGAERTLPTCTTHLNVVDRDGGMVALTQTLLSSFGACVLSPSTGVLLNNGVNWFDPVPGRPNSLGADRRALSNYTPALFTRDGGGNGNGDADVIAIGGSGGRKIIPAVSQALAQIADHGAALDAAIAGPRIDVSAPPRVVADARLPAAVLDALAARHDTVLAERIASPNHFCILGGVRRRADGVNEGHTEPFHPWADAVAEDDPALDAATRGLWSE